MRQLPAGARPVARSPEYLLVAGFAGTILIGALLLWLLPCHQGAVGPVEALFTATSAVCVTGLVVVDTGSEFTVTGQALILLLIQVGGLGVMTFAAVAVRSLGRRLSLRAQAALSETMVQRDVALEFGELFGKILRIVFAIEAIGAVVISIGLLGVEEPLWAGWSAIFHSISAFCNAGFSLYPDSLMRLRGSIPIIGAVTTLILLGGLGHPVLVELWGALGGRIRGESGPPGLLSLHSRLAISTSGLLVGAGALGLLLLGSGGGGFLASVAASVFQSVSARTAGFNTVAIGELPVASLLLLVGLMFIGGSPGSCAGGIKTTSFVIWLAGVRASLRGDPEVLLFGRRIPDDVVVRVGAILGLSLLWNAAGILLLAITEAHTRAGLHELVFEQVSAFGTVGLSTGVTPRLSTAGKLWIVATMFAGRVGPLTIAMTLLERKTVRVRHPEGRVMIG